MGAGLREEADGHFARQEFALAADLYRRALAYDRNDFAAARSLGLCLAASKQFDEAIEVCRGASLAAPADADLRYALGYALAGRDRFDEAIVELDAALYQQPNHIRAKEILLFSLCQRARRDLESNPHGAERDVDRAHKLDPRNPEIAGQLLGVLLDSSQRGKALHLLESFDAETKAHPAVAPLFARMQADPSYAVALKQVAARAAAASGPIRQTETLAKVPCPNCKAPIMSYAAICPHCNFKVRAYGTFSGHDPGPKVEWQEVAYTIVSVLLLLSACYDLYAAYRLRDPQMRGYFLVLSVVEFLVALGLVFRQEWVMFVGKIFCIVMILNGGWGMMMSLGLGHWVAGLMSVAQIAVAGLMIYLINYLSD